MKHRYHYIRNPGFNMHFEDEYPKTSPIATIILVHGFPDFWFSWRHQIPVLVNAGYRVIVPDLPGFGHSMIPTHKTIKLKYFSLKSVIDYLKELLDDLDIKKAIFIGHDWGGEVVWRMYLHHPKKVLAIAALCTPYVPPKLQYVPLEQVVEKLPTFKYQLYFCNNTRDSNEEFKHNTEKFFKLMFLKWDSNVYYKFFADGTNMIGAPVHIEENDLIVTKQELTRYVQLFQETEFFQALHWYKTRQINFNDEKGLDPNINIPALMITAGKDKVLTPEMTSKMDKFIPKLSRVHIEDAGHWVHVEQKERVNKALLEWLQNIIPEFTSKL
jgi:soluble epoxide hydrolase/lipid-phosphate phosphatase